MQYLHPYLSGNIYILEYYLRPKSPSGIIYFVQKPKEYIYRTGPGYIDLAVNINWLVEKLI